MDNPEKLATFGTQDDEKQKHTTICVGHHYAQANTNNVNTSWALLQTTGGKDEPNIVPMRKSNSVQILTLTIDNEGKRRSKWYKPYYSYLNCEFPFHM